MGRLRWCSSTFCASAGKTFPRRGPGWQFAITSRFGWGVKLAVERVECLWRLRP